MEILVKFITFTCGAPVLGWLLGHMAITCLTKVYNEPIVEIMITLSVAYSSYLLAENIFRVSGVLTLVTLGIVMAAHKESITPEVEDLVHRFWEILAYFSNTVIFFLVGMVIVIKAAGAVERNDLFLITATYIGVNVFRLAMIACLSPILSRMGYGLSWQDSLVMAWGGLRGAMGLALALLVFYNPHLSQHLIGSKILIHTAAIVAATLLINATTIKLLLLQLGMTQVSDQKKSNMYNSVKHLRKAQERSIRVLKADPFLADSDWKFVEEFTTIKDIYQAEDAEALDEEDMDLLPLTLKCGVTFKGSVICPSKSELKEMVNNARIRLLHLLKSSFWRQFELGLLTRDNVHQLMVIIDFAEDKEGQFLTINELLQNWNFRKYYWLKSFLDKHKRPVEPEACTMVNPRGSLQKFMYRVVCHPLFLLYSTLNILTTCSLVSITFLFFNITEVELDFFFYGNLVCIALFAFELLIKVLGCRWQMFWSANLNKLDTVLIIKAAGDLSLSLAFHREDLKEVFNSISILIYARILLLLRCLHLYYLIRQLLNRLYVHINYLIDSRLYSGFDMGCGYVKAYDEVIKMLDDIVDFQPIVQKLQNICEENHFLTKCALSQFQDHHRSVAIAVKTRHAAQSTLNDIKEELHQIKHAGLLDKAVYESLIGQIQVKMQRLLHAPKALLPSPPMETLKKIEWVTGNKMLFRFLKTKVEVKMFKKGEYIALVGEPPSGIYIITVGVIKVEGVIIINENGTIPNTDSYEWFTSHSEKLEDNLSIGSVLGELGVLSNQSRFTSLVAETEVQVLHISQDTMLMALDHFKEPSLEKKLWKICSLKIAQRILSKHPAYVNFSLSQLILHLERSYVPQLPHYSTFQLTSGMEDVILIQGKAYDPATQMYYRGVRYIPYNVSSLRFEDSKVLPKVLVVVNILHLQDFNEADHSLSNSFFQAQKHRSFFRFFPRKKQIPLRAELRSPPLATRSQPSVSSTTSATDVSSTSASARSSLIRANSSKTEPIQTKSRKFRKISRTVPDTVNFPEASTEDSKEGPSSTSQTNNQ